MLWMYQRVFFGKITNPANEKLIDLSFREKCVLVPLVVMIFWIGFYPKPFFTILEPSVKQVIRQVEKARNLSDVSRQTRKIPVLPDSLRTLDIGR